tara:strand:- start:4928 stop:5092 length:165 start_codon:yes stop_codon:yes gene_type:complete
MGAVVAVVTVAVVAGGAERIGGGCGAPQPLSQCRQRKIRHQKVSQPKHKALAFL